MPQEKIVLRLATPHGNYYDITEAGNIVRLDIPGFSPSGNWKFLGLSHVRRSEFIPFEQVVRLAKSGKLPTLVFKNGKPQYTVRDFDHGSVRTWGNTNFHGVRSIWAMSAQNSITY